MINQFLALTDTWKIIRSSVTGMYDHFQVWLKNTDVHNGILLFRFASCYYYSE